MFFGPSLLDVNSGRRFVFCCFFVWHFFLHFWGEKYDEIGREKQRIFGIGVGRNFGPWWTGRKCTDKRPLSILSVICDRMVPPKSGTESSQVHFFLTIKVILSITCLPASWSFSHKHKIACAWKSVGFFVSWLAAHLFRNRSNLAVDWSLIFKSFFSQLFTKALFLGRL